MHDFTDFPSAKLHEIWTQHVDRCCGESFRNRISEHNFENFPVMGRFSPKRKFVAKMFNIFRLQAAVIPQKL